MVTLKNKRIIVSRQVDCTTEEVWRVITDTEQWPRWGPSVSGVKCSQRHIGPASTGYVKIIMGLWLPFTITEYQHLHYWSWRIGRVQATGHRLTETGADTCMVSFDLPWWAGPYVLVCSIALSRISRLTGSNGVPR